MNIKIVIADDHQMFIDGIKSILSTEIGIEIIGEANNGFDLLKLLDNEVKPDIIITDIRMPVMDGIVLTRIVKKEYSGMPVLALSMYNQEPDVIEMMDAGAKGYIVKNAGKEEMLKAIYALNSGQTYFSGEIKEAILSFKDRKSKKIPLTRRETEILRLIAEGRTSIQISKELNISKLTVDTHRKNIHKKLGVDSYTGLLKYAIEQL